MKLFIILFMMNRLDVGLSSSYITKIERVVDLPAGVLFLKPTIEYGSSWGGLIEDFYVSVDCNDRKRDIYIELGANCCKVGPFYRGNIGGLEFTPNAGFLRIDVAALATGEFGGYKYAGQIDEERNGGFLGLKLKHPVSDVLRLTPFFSVGIVSRGIFWEYGGELAFKPFKHRKVANYLKELAFTTGISIAQLGYTAESESYTITFGYYLVGVSYELAPPKPPVAEKLEVEKPEVKVDTLEVKTKVRNKTARNRKPRTTQRRGRT